MYTKGKIRADGAKLARYLMEGGPDETAQVIDTRGWEAFGRDPVTAFRRMELWAAEISRSSKPFFHGHIRLPSDERLTDEQWRQSVDRMEKRLGFPDQPRIVSFHIDDATGEKHLHVAWFRIDLETERAIDPGLFKNHLKQLSRTLEKDFALREISNVRQPHDRARAAGRDELEESRRLGTNVREIRTAILDSFEQSDGGKAFKAALEGSGFVLANGDRRDCFVVIDPAGGQHALNKKLTGLTLAQTRDRLADLDRSQLPSVDQAKEMQAARQAQEREKHGRGADGQGREDRPTGSGPQNAPQPDYAAAQGWRADIRPASNQNTRETMTLDAVMRDPWKAVDLELPKDADFALLAAVAASARQCERAAAAHARVDQIVHPEGVALDLERGASAEARLAEAERMLAELPPERRTVAPFLNAARMQDLALWNILGAYLDGSASREPPAIITATEIDRDPWSVLRCNLDSLTGASAELVERVIGIAESLREEALRRRDETSYGPEERELWEDLATIATGTVKEAQSHPSRDGKRIWSFAEMERPGTTAEEVRPDYAAAKGRRDDMRSGFEAAAREATARSEQGQEAPSRPPAPEEASRHAGELPRAAEPVQEIEQVVENAVDASNRAATRILGGVAKAVGRMFEALADMISPAPLPTKEEVRQQQRAEAEAAPIREAVRSQAEWEARLAEGLDDDARRRRRRREEGRDYERDDDRGRERDRS